jgi:hypothetical protein
MDAYSEGRLRTFADLLCGMGLARPPVIDDSDGAPAMTTASGNGMVRQIYIAGG